MSSLFSLGPDEAICSRSGCSELAAWRIDWHNPRIHRDGRVKTWLACDDHRANLTGFLTSRDFPVDVVPFMQAGSP